MDDCGQLCQWELAADRDGLPQQLLPLLAPAAPAGGIAAGYQKAQEGMDWMKECRHGCMQQLVLDQASTTTLG